MNIEEMLGRPLTHVEAGNITSVRVHDFATEMSFYNPQLPESRAYGLAVGNFHAEPNWTERDFAGRTVVWAIEEGSANDLELVKKSFKRAEDETRQYIEKEKEIKEALKGIDLSSLCTCGEHRKDSEDVDNIKDTIQEALSKAGLEATVIKVADLQKDNGLSTDILEGLIESFGEMDVPEGCDPEWHDINTKMMELALRIVKKKADLKPRDAAKAQEVVDKLADAGTTMTDYFLSGK